MILKINNNNYRLEKRKNSNINFFLLAKKNNLDGYFIENANSINTFFTKNKLDIIAINNKNSVIFKYQNVPQNKIVEVNSDKKNTNIIVLPSNISKSLKINDILSFVDEDII